jgi:hypothetical protein
MNVLSKWLEYKKSVFCIHTYTINAFPEGVAQHPRSMYDVHFTKVSYDNYMQTRRVLSKPNAIWSQIFSGVKERKEVTIHYHHHHHPTNSPMLDIGLSNFSPSRPILGYSHPAPTSRPAQIVTPPGLRASYTTFTETREYKHTYL